MRIMRTSRNLEYSKNARVLLGNGLTLRGQHGLRAAASMCGILDELGSLPPAKNNRDIHKYKETYIFLYLYLYIYIYIYIFIHISIYIYIYICIYTYNHIHKCRNQRLFGMKNSGIGIFRAIALAVSGRVEELQSGNLENLGFK